MISVIVPTRNSARTLASCLASVRGQEVTEMELIVVDNSSTDATAAIAIQYADVFAIRGPERSAQRNFGASIAGGEYLFFVDSDMILSTGLVSECMAILNATGGSAVIVPETSTGQGFWAACRALERRCYVGDDLVEAARFFRRTAFEAVGGYDEQLWGGEDWDLSARVASGARLPRTIGGLIHDEGRLRLGAALAKKRYYAGSFVAYWRKHPRRALSQANVVRPAFLRNWRIMIRHPILASGIAVMKLAEMGAALSVVLPQLAARKNMSADTPVGTRGRS